MNAHPVDPPVATAPPVAAPPLEPAVQSDPTRSDPPDAPATSAAATWSLRVELAAAFRMAARLGWQEAVANHFSVALRAAGSRFLINPRWRSFAALRASDLLVLDAGAPAGALPPDIDRTAWAIHGTMHARLPRARCILHVHPPYATALSCLQDPTLRPIDQTSARFFRRVAIDRDYGGMADTADEGLRLTRALGDKCILLMGHHGVLVIGDTIAEAFDALFHVERACQTLVLAYSTGQPVAVLPDEIAERTARCWEDGGAFARAHFAAIRQRLDLEEPGYAQ